jgi:predicted metalloprotease with PDZ domain
MMITRASLACCFLLVTGLAVPAVAAEVVQHRISFPQAHLQYVHVVSQFPADDGVTDLLMASWAPGSYLMREFSGNLDRISIHDEQGQPLAFSKVAKNRWRIETTGVESVVAEYDVHAGNLSVRTSWVSEEFSLINGTSVFLYSDASRDLPQELTVEVPAGLLKVHTPLRSTGSASIFRARDFDHLADSPVVIADAPLYEYQSAGTAHLFLNVGETALWDGATAAEDVKSIADVTQAFWEVNPLQDGYWLFNFLVEGRGGLEHDQSSVIMAGRWQMRNREDYLRWLSVVAHEYFHAWNVRRLRPRELLRYDYGQEQYSSQLWSWPRNYTDSRPRRGDYSSPPRPPQGTHGYGFTGRFRIRSTVR